MQDGSDTALAEAAVLHFGLTDDPRECGYVLRDGRMLDLSGRHYDPGYERRGDRNVVRRGRDYHAAGRVVDHRELGELLDVGGTDGMLEFMARTGAVRVRPGQGFTMMVAPTSRQVALMCVAARFYGDEAHFEVYDRKGDVTAFGFFREPSPRDVIGVLLEAGLLTRPAGPAGP